MQKERLLASGGLNTDVEEYFLPKGDYIDAKNIVVDSGLSGGQGTIKKIEGKNQLRTYTGTIKAACEYDNIIYFLTRVELLLEGQPTTHLGYIYRLDGTTLDILVKYDHKIQEYSGGISDNDFDPFLKKIGDILVWNYAEKGTPLYWLTTRATGTTKTIDDLKLIKETPNFTPTILKNINATGNESDFLSNNDFQFAMRYQYDTKEYSALSSFSKVFKAEPDILNYTITHTISNKPSFVEKIFFYVRIGNAGTFRRIDTVDISSSNSISITWNGDILESLPDTVSAKPFDAVPINTKAIEVAENRILLGNNLDDYTNDATNTINISLVGSGYTISTTNGTIKNYFGNDVTTASNAINSSETDDDTAHKPFANNSTYKIGYAFYDDNMRTRGVEKSVDYKTGDFAYGTNGIIPTIKLNFTNSDVSTCMPSWAKYLQILYSKNLSKSYVFEGYASAFWFELQEEGLADPLFSGQTRTTFETRRILKLNLAQSDLKNIKFLTVDLMSMFRNGKVYTYTEGDRIRINLAETSTATNIVDLKILGQSGSLVFCEYDLGGIDLSNAYSYQQNNYFEIYSPKQIGDEENTIFFEGGNLIPISAFSDSTTDYFISEDGSNTSIPVPSGDRPQQPTGDMIFESLNLFEYTETPFKTITSVANSQSDEDVVTTVKTSREINKSNVTQSAPITGSAVTVNGTASFSVITANGDGGTIDSSGRYVLANSYIDSDQDSSDTIKITSGTATLDVSLNNVTLASNSSSFTADGKIELLKNGSLVGTAFNMTQLTGTLGDDGNATIGSQTKSFNSNHSFGTLESSGIGTLNHTDTLSLRLTLTTTNLHVTGSGSASVNFDCNNLILTINGDRRLVTTSVEFDNNAAIGNAEDYLIRSISKAEKNPKWNTSSGKPSIQVTSDIANRKFSNIRYGGKYIQGTNVNDISSFFFLNEKEVAEENGPIRALQRTSKLQTEGQVVLAISEKETSSLYLNERIVVDGAGNSLIASSGQFLGSIRNLKGGYGCKDIKSIVQYRGNVYWWDSNKKKVVRYNRNGLTPISEIGMRNYFSSQTASPSGYIIPTYDMYVIDFGTDNAIGFSERNKRWISKYNGSIELGIVKPSGEIKNSSNAAAKYGEQAIFFRGGNVSGESSARFNSYVNFASTNAFIQFVLNTPTPITLENVTISQLGSDFVDFNQSNNLRTSTFDVDFDNENGQTSKVKDVNCLLQDKYIYGHIMRDSNSSGGIINGDFMIGTTNKVKLTITDGNDDRDYKINLLSIGYNPSSGHDL